MAKTITPFLMFDGRAEEAMDFYTSVFPDSKLKRVQEYGPGGAGPEGKIMRADFTLAGQDFICIDSPAEHGFSFTPSVSMFVECQDEAEFNKLYEQLSDGGEILMPPDNYGFSQRFCWLNDRFGVSWQLNVG